MRKRKHNYPRVGGLDRWLAGNDNKPPATVSMSESTRQRYFKIFPNAEKRYTEWLKRN